MPINGHHAVQALLSNPALAWTAMLALLLVLVPAARNLLVELVCHVYVALVHRPFRSSPIDFLFTGQERPLPRTNSIWSRTQATTTLKWQAQRRGLRHEKEISWGQPGSVREGDMIEAWDRVVEWDPQCFHPHKLEMLRDVGDPVADAALGHIDSVPCPATPVSTDTLRHLYDRAFQGGAENTACQRFWHSIDRRPPPGAGALGLEWYRSCYGNEAVNGLEQWPRSPSTETAEPFATLPSWSPHGANRIDARDGPQEIEAEAEIIRRGQDVFYRYAGPMLTVLLHFSLAGGFASPRITEVLKQTAYLVPTATSRNVKGTRPSGRSTLPTVEELKQIFNVDKARADRTWDRLLETTQFVLDVVEKADSLRPPSSSAPAAEKEAAMAPPDCGGEGWQSAVRVRLLHANVRRRVLKLAQKRRSDPFGPSGSVYDVEKNGVPINQEDLLGTLCAFSAAPLAMLQRLGISPTVQERKDYIALWRHVGFYMGIEPALLRCAFRDPYAADRTLWCTVLHLFSNVEIVDGLQSEQPGGSGSGPRFQGPTIPVLIACADRAPFHTPLSAHVGISRRLLGQSLADSLALPASSATREVLTDIGFMGMRIPILFGSMYPRRSWERRKLQLARPLLRRLIVFSFGNKRTKFELPAQPPTTATAGNKADDAERVNVETKSDSHLDVPEDRELNQALAREWRWLMREMFGVLFVVASLAIGLSTAAYVYLAPRLCPSCS